MEVRQVIEEKIKAKIEASPDCLKGAGIQDKNVVFEIEGSGGGTWSFSFDSEGLVTMSEASSSASNASIWMKVPTFEKLLGGNLNVPMAVVMRKIKVKGDASLAGNIGLAIQKLV